METVEPSSQTNLENVQSRDGHQMREIAGEKSDDGNVWIGGAAYRMNPDGTDVEVIGHNFRNSYEQTSHLLVMFSKMITTTLQHQGPLIFLNMEMPDSVQRTANEAGSLIAVQVNRLKSPNGDKKILEQCLPVTFMEEALQQESASMKAEH